MRHGNVPSLRSCDWFYGLELFRGTFERLHKISKSKQTQLATRKGMLNLAIRSPQSSLLARGGCKNSCSKTMYSRYKYLTLQRWFKSASSLTVDIVFHPIFWLTW